MENRLKQGDKIKIESRWYEVVSARRRKGPSFPYLHRTMTENDYMELLVKNSNGKEKWIDCTNSAGNVWNEVTQI